MPDTREKTTGEPIDVWVHEILSTAYTAAELADKKIYASKRRLVESLQGSVAKLLEIPEAILLTKIDQKAEEEVKVGLKALRTLGKPVMSTSIYDENSIEKLQTFLQNSIICEVK